MTNVVIHNVSSHTRVEGNSIPHPCAAPHLVWEASTGSSLQPPPCFILRTKTAISNSKLRIYRIWLSIFNRQPSDKRDDTFIKPSREGRETPHPSKILEAREQSSILERKRRRMCHGSKTKIPSKPLMRKTKNTHLALQRRDLSCGILRQELLVKNCSLSVNIRIWKNYRNLVSSMRADDPRMPLVTLIQHLCGRHVRLDGSIRSDRLRQRGYRIDVHAGLLEKLSICRGSAIGKFAHRMVEVPMLSNVIGRSLEI